MLDGLDGTTNRRCLGWLRFYSGRGSGAAARCIFHNFLAHLVCCVFSACAFGWWGLGLYVYRCFFLFYSACAFRTSFMHRYTDLHLLPVNAPHTKHHTVSYAEYHIIYLIIAVLVLDDGRTLEETKSYRSQTWDGTSVFCNQSGMGWW